MMNKAAISFALFCLVATAVGQPASPLGGVEDLLKGVTDGVGSITKLHKGVLCRKLALIGQDNIAMCKDVMEDKMPKEGKKDMKMKDEKKGMEEGEIMYVTKVPAMTAGAAQPKATAGAVHPKATAGAVSPMPVHHPKATAEAMPMPMPMPKPQPVKILKVVPAVAPVAPKMPMKKPEPTPIFKVVKVVPAAVEPAKVPMKMPAPLPSAKIVKVIKP